MLLMAAVILIISIVFLLMSTGSRNIEYICIDGELRGSRTCVLPGYAVIVNRVYGEALVSIDGGKPIPLGNGSIIAHMITYTPVMHVVNINNESQVMFNVLNPIPKWVNVSLPGECIVTMNVTILGSGYVSIMAITNNRTIAYTPYTYSLVLTIPATDNLSIFIKPAIILSCPCINTITLVRINGTCIRQSNAYIIATAHINEQHVDVPLLTSSLMLMIIAIVMLLTSIARYKSFMQ